MSRSSYLRRKFHENFFKIDGNSIFVFHFVWNVFLKSKKISLVVESQKVENFRLSGKFEIKAQPVDQFSWKKFQSPILIVWSSLQSFSFVCLSSCSQSRGKVFSLEPYSEATRNFPGPKKIQRAYFDPFTWVPNFIPKY